MSKKFCPTHHLYYNGVECPMCLQDRVSKLEKHYTPTQEPKKIQEEREITESDLEALVNKFNVK